MSRKSGALGIASELFLEILDHTVGEDFFLTKSGMRKLAKELSLNGSQFNSAVQALSRKGFIEKKNDSFLITPKGLQHSKVLKIEREDWSKSSTWDGKWQLVIFDIPERMRSQRNVFRSFLKRKKFTKLQNSVFISPFANDRALDIIRRELKITNYVILLEAKTSELQDDSALRRKYLL